MQTTMTQALRASAALEAANNPGRPEGVLTPSVFGCPYGHTARIVASPLPFGRCGRCGTEMDLLATGRA